MTDDSFDSTSIIGECDGPTAYFVAKESKRRIGTHIHKKVYLLKKKFVTTRIEPNAHTMEETMTYLKEKYHFEELSANTEEYQNSYTEQRVSSLMQYAPELLGEYSEMPKLASNDEAGIKEVLRQIELRQQKAEEVPKEMFDIDLHIYEKREEGREMQLIFETKYGYIGGNCGYEGTARKTSFDKIYKDVYRYYGVTDEDIKKKSKRYQALLSALVS